MRTYSLFLNGLACGFFLAGCQIPALIEPQRDLTREYEAEITELKSRAQAFCAVAGGEVDSLQIRIKRTDEGARVRMEADCDPGASKIQCTLLAGAGETPECAQVGG